MLARIPALVFMPVILCEPTTIFANLCGSTSKLALTSIISQQVIIT